MIEYKNILFGTDFSEDAGVAFLHALDMAKRYNSTLHVLHVLHSGYKYSRHIVDEMADSPEGEEFVDENILRKAEAKIQETYGEKLGDLKNVKVSVLAGIPFVEIVKYAKQHDIDLIVLGSRGKSEFNDITFGSTVANVAQRAHCHVAAIRNPKRAFTLPGAMPL